MGRAQAAGSFLTIFLPIGHACSQNILFDIIRKLRLSCATIRVAPHKKPYTYLYQNTA